jgi:hypothetical protein
MNHSLSILVKLASGLSILITIFSPYDVGKVETLISIFLPSVLSRNTIFQSCGFLFSSIFTLLSTFNLVIIGEIFSLSSLSTIKKSQS